MKLTTIISLACYLMMAPYSMTHAAVILDSSLVDIESNSNIFRDFRGDSSTRSNGDRLAVSIKVSDADDIGDMPRPDTLVVVKQLENGGNPNAETGISFQVPEFFGPAIPNQYGRSVAWNDSFLDTAWKIVALPNNSTAPSPNTDREVVLTQDSTISSTLNAHPLPLSTGITLDGNGTLSWTIPETDVFYNGYRVSVIRESDRKQLTAQNGLPIDWDNGTQKSLSINLSDLELAGPSSDFVEGEAYELRIETRHIDTSRDISGQVSRSSTFANFTLLPEGTDAVFLPTLDMEGTFHFDFEVVIGETYPIDPFIATGYEYALGDGDPLFESVLIPEDFTVTGVDVYQLIVGGDSFDLAANELFTFNGDGVEGFQILGIDPELMLDPADTTAFVTHVTFSDNGQFTGTMVPITENFAVPSPSPLILMAGGLIPLFRRKLGG